MKTYLCKCNNCGNVFIDKNPQIDALLHEVKIGEYEQLRRNNTEQTWDCPVCNTDGYLVDM